MPKKIYNKKKCEFLIFICLLFSVSGIIALLIGVIKGSVIIFTIGALCILGVCLIKLLNIDEISGYVADGILSTLREAENDDIIIKFVKCQRTASKMRKHRSSFLWRNKSRR